MSDSKAMIQAKRDLLRLKDNLDDHISYMCHLTAVPNKRLNRIKEILLNNNLNVFDKLESISQTVNKKD